MFSAPAAAPWAGGGGGGGGNGGGGGDAGEDASSPEVDSTDDGGGYDAGADDSGNDAAGDAPADDGGDDMGGLAGWFDAFVRPGRARSIGGQRLMARTLVRARNPRSASAIDADVRDAVARFYGTGKYASVPASQLARRHDFGDAGDEEGLGAIDYNAYLEGGQLADWTDDLLNVGKGAASGALSTTASLLAQQGQRSPVAPVAPVGMSMGTKIAIGAAVALPLMYVLTRKKAAAPTPVAA